MMIMVQMLLEDKRRDEVGLLVDWLELLDPTIICSRAADEAPVRQV